MANKQVYSFKLRGAYNKMAQLTAEELGRGVICSSAGNHAQGVALASRELVNSLGASQCPPTPPSLHLLPHSRLLSVFLEIYKERCVWWEEGGQGTRM